MPSAPRVTAIIATYDWSTVLPYSIGSVLRQTYQDLELLVIGDGCTDDSEAVVRAAAAGDPRVRWINLPENTGTQSGPNAEGMRQARGDVIAYLGHDDLWLPHHLAVLVPAVDRGADVAYGVVAAVPPDIRRPPWPNPPRFARYRGQWINPTGFVHRREAAERAGGWRPWRELRRHPDYHLLLQMRAAGCTFELVPRLTAIKLAAIVRPNCYRERPCHEQAAWTERILREPDLEATLLVRMLGAAQERAHARLTLRGMLGRAGSRLRRLGRWLLGFKRGDVDRRRRVRGLEPIP